MFQDSNFKIKCTLTILSVFLVVTVAQLPMLRQESCYVVIIKLVFSPSNDEFSQKVILDDNNNVLGSQKWGL